MDDAAEQVQHLIGLIQETRSLYFQLATAIADDTAPEVVYAARAVHEMRGALAKKEVGLETYAAAHRNGRRERVMADLKKAWDAGRQSGIAEGIRRANLREQARSIGFPRLALVRTLPWLNKGLTATSPDTRPAGQSRRRTSPQPPRSHARTSGTSSTTSSPAPAAHPASTSGECPNISSPARTPTSPARSAADIATCDPAGSASACAAASAAPSSAPSRHDPMPHCTCSGPARPAIAARLTICAGFAIVARNATARGSPSSASWRSAATTGDVLG